MEHENLEPSKNLKTKEEARLMRRQNRTEIVLTDVIRSEILKYAQKHFNS
jgi:hypothetical protein